ncbi:MAG: hypothetical protein GY841_06700 [FCB group bacterium]|nr:hypothetical protein [FCB group bacterium]
MLKRFRKSVDQLSGEPQIVIESVREKFSLFLALLDHNNHVLEIMSDMEEKAQGEYLFDVNYIHNCLAEINIGVIGIIDNMVKLGGEKYQVLQDRFDEISNVVETVLPGKQPIVGDDLTIPFDRLNRTRALSVGSKNAQLGEMKAILGLSVPEGFAITARAYKAFVEYNDLQVRITRRINAVDIKSYEELERISAEITEMILTSPMPRNLEAEIMASHRELVTRSTTDKCSMRSSAVGEDTLFSFAGQYASYLNVHTDDLIDCYREILASKFTPQAIYYFLSHSLSEAELAMSVGCVSMIDAAVSGVIYTRDPIRPDEEIVLINSIFGLGKYLVNGTLTPDMFVISRADRKVSEQTIAEKAVRLVMHVDHGTIEESVPEEMQSKPSLNTDQIAELVDCALKLEEHYRSPQDIEWAIDRNGRLFLLQSRPLQVLKGAGRQTIPETSDYPVIFSGGSTVCPGAGSGPIYHVKSIRDLPGVPQGSVLAAPNPFPGLVTIMGRINALITRVGGPASHMATIAREYHLPTLTGVELAEELSDGRMVTVDASGRMIYDGNRASLVEARKPEYDVAYTSSIYTVLDRVLDLVSPLRLVHPADDDFIPENCMSYHDITRYSHQRAMEEMFLSAHEVAQDSTIGFKFKSDLPVDLNIIYIDRDFSSETGRQEITEEELNSLPMKALWEGIKQEGWPSQPTLVPSMQAIGTNLTERDRHEFSESSFAILGQEYMVVSLRMGYHFTTIEAMCTEETSKNYIQMQYKDGGALLDRRIRRIRVLTEILSRLGFVQQQKSDFLNSTVVYQDRQAIEERLKILGRLVIMSKQLDMALSTDAVAEWYTNDMLSRLGIKKN